MDSTFAKCEPICAYVQKYNGWSSHLATHLCSDSCTSVHKHYAIRYIFLVFSDRKWQPGESHGGVSSVPEYIMEAKITIF